MIKNLILYRTTNAPDAAAFEEALQRARFVECTPTQPEAFGFIPPRGIAHGPLVEIVNGHYLMKIQHSKRVLPSDALRRKVDEIAAKIEEQTGRKPGKKARKDLQDQALHELLPHTQTQHNHLMLWLDPDRRMLAVGAPTLSRCDEIVSSLIKLVDGLALHLIQTAEAPAACMAAWLMDGQPPEGFTVDRECELKSEDEMKSAVRYARHALDIEEVRQHLTAGKRPTQLALSYKDRVSLMLTDTLQLKKIALLDLVFEGRTPAEKDEQFDADAVIFTAELGALVDDLLHALGGEHDFRAAGLLADQAEPSTT